MTARDAATAAVALFMPEAGPQERELRARIYHARDIAVSKMRNELSFDAQRLYSIAANVASAWVFRRRADTSDLSDILAVLSRLFTSANALERLEAGDAE